MKPRRVFRSQCPWARSCLVPSESVMIDGTPTVAWYQSDPVTGETIGVMEDGGHQSSFEYAGLLKLLNPTAFLAGVVAGVFVSNFAFIAGVVSVTDCQVDCKAKAIARGLLFVDILIAAVVTVITFSFKGELLKSFLAGFGLAVLAMRKIWGSVDPPVTTHLVNILGAEPLPDPGPFMIAIAPEDLFTIPFDGVQLPLGYRARIKNPGASADTFTLSADAPSGFRIKTSVESITIPAGGVVEVGVCLVPEDLATPVGEPVVFEVAAISDTDPSVSASASESAPFPAVQRVSVALSRATLSAGAGSDVTTELEVSAVGNTAVQGLPLSVDVSSDLTVAGLPANIDLDVGETRVIPITLSVAAGAADNALLDAIFSATFGQDPRRQSLRRRNHRIGTGAVRRCAACRRLRRRRGRCRQRPACRGVDEHRQRTLGTRAAAGRRARPRTIGAAL